ncbi:MAG TPA: VOC family protein [Xanthomonadales bacterium]|nr:VOC family protein [Xanthomonadales bacterium]
MTSPDQNPIRIRAIDHVVIRTAHVATLLRFYVDVLGCAVERELAPEFGLIQLRAGNSLIDLVDVNGELGRMGGPAPGKDGHNLDHFCLEIDALDEQALLDWLAANGIESSNFERRYGANGFGRSVYIQDPDGNTVELKLAATGS